MLFLLFIATLVICCLPLVPGLIGILLPALSWLPMTDLTEPGFQAFGLAFAWPGIQTSVWLTLSTGVISTLMAMVFTFLILQKSWGSRRWHTVESWLSPILAIPHVAFAIGFAFTFSSTGILARIITSLGGDPGQFSLLQDPYGLGLTLALAMKETPFLLLMSISVLQQLNVSRLLAVGSGLGYNQTATWINVILPQWLPKMRLPIFAVLAYGISVVDMAMILGPTRPPTFAVLVWQWFNDPDISLMPRAAVGALMLLILGLALMLLFRGLEWLLCRGYPQWQYAGHRQHHLPGRSLHWPLILVPLMVIPVLVTWSVALRWRFPDLLPSRFSLRFWQQETTYVADLVSTSLLLAAISTLIALILAIGCLEYREKTGVGLPGWLIAMPMVLPQVSLLFGIQVTTYLIPGQHYLLWVIWSHVLFVFPYLYLALDGPWRSFDRRYTQTASSLGLSALSAWWRVKRPMLMPAICMAIAVGCSVSLAQYLPTLSLGAGRVSTLTTEAVALASGQDRRVSAIYGLLQGFVPFMLFITAMLASRYYQTKMTSPKTTRNSEPHVLIREKPHYK
ncbi:ABC transporter permease [Photobacterium galatheae]|uniref:Thiamine ABC transporter permease n=1 Tax=Photobacterium galatheae TaxID=1654360 RepID=A0A066RV47_9GAMM|nr:thiamine ABC transporter permease [Photobacterium galatheae]KDM91577.1 thiamine ABC transporter permease [Photobacterium galatheae]MCM0149650.1 thiamine ABC transporter permease [Photobacterium galatheae]